MAMRNSILRRLLPQFVLAFALLGGSVFNAANAACTTQGCVMAGPRLLSVDTTQGELLNALLGGLTGTSVNLTAADWSSLANTDIKVASMLNALQVTANTLTPEQALTFDATVLELLNAAATATTVENRADVAAKINALAVPLSVLSPKIQLGDLLKIANAPGNSTINVLDLLTGVVQLYSSKYGAVTPSPITISTGNIAGLTGVTSISLAASVVEAPVYVCGVGGAQFHTASIRVKLNVTIPVVAAIVNPLNSILDVTASNVTLLNNFSLYIELARAEGTIVSLNAASSAINLHAIPGVADLYLGSIPDSTFFNRSRSLAYADFQPVLIGNLTLTTTILFVTTNVTGTIKLRTTARGQAPIGGTDFTLTAPFPKSRTVDTGTAFVSNLVTSLLNNLELTVTLNLLPILNLDISVSGLVKPLVSGLLSPILTTVLTTVADPLLKALGIKLGEAVITAHGFYTLCAVSGSVYNDANHSSVREFAETGTGLTLYAKLVATSSPTTVYKSAVVDTGTGAFSFTNVVAEGYNLIVDTNNTASDVTATRPTAWVATETPTLIRSFTLTYQSTDLTGQTYGLYNGSSLTGRVFSDTGAGSGTANNTVRDGTEPSIPGVTVSLTDSGGTTTHDTTVSGNDGVYTLWVPASVGASALKLVEANLAAYTSIGANVGNTLGVYTRATDTVAFTNVVGTSYSGVNFADVPATQFNTDGRQTVIAGNVAFYPHTFVAGTSGQITFSGTAPTVAGWTHEIFNDTNCNGAIDTGEQHVATNLSVTAAQKLCLLIKVYAPVTAALNEQYPLTVGASFAYANSALADALARNDLTVVGTSTDAGLHLAKSVDKSSAKSGDVLVYTITYANHSASGIKHIKIFDSTPAYTVFTSAACGPLATGLTGCSLTAQPSAGATGKVEWSMTGTLSPGATGTVTLQVTLQ